MNADSGCPDTELLDLFVTNQLPDHLDQKIEEHVEACNVCLTNLEQRARKSRHLFELSQGSEQQKISTIYAKPEISGYEILEFYKSGGQGLVFKAWDKILNRHVAVKILKDFAGQVTGQDSSIIIEARAIARLSHPNIVKVHGLTWTAQGPAMIMDWVEGESLHEHVKNKSLTKGQAVDLLIRLCEAVALAHEAGVLHRDIKPSNILLNHNSLEEPMLCDFGLAKLKKDDGDFSTATVGVGTAGYMPPEMISKRFGKVSASSDIYSIGALLYHLLTGRLPHESHSVYETMEKTCEKDVTPPTFFDREIPWDLETICLKCMRREPELRYHSVMSLKSDLEKFRRNQPVQARRASTEQKLRLWSREHPWVAALSVSLFGVLTASVILLSYALNRAVQGERKTERELARTSEILEASVPLVKHFLQLGVLKDDEIKRIKRLAALLKEIDSEATDLRRQFDLIYVGLELANGLELVNGQKNLSIQMTSQARYSLKKLIDDHGPELDRMGFVMDGDKIDISILDQSMVRYGHSCIQLSNIIRYLNPESGWKESEPFVDEAIQTAEQVIKKNPEVDEAYSDLANYYTTKSQILMRTGRTQEALEIPLKIEPIQASMMQKYPNAPEKVIFWLVSVQNILNTRLKTTADELLLHQTIQRVKQEMQRVQARNDVQWPLTANAFANTLLIEPRYDFKTRPIDDVWNQIKPLMSIFREFIAAKPPLAVNVQSYLDIGLETMAVLESDETRHDEALALFRELEAYFSGPSADMLNPLRLAELYLRSPIPDTGSAEKTLTLLKRYDPKDINVERLMNLWRLTNDPLFEIPFVENSADPEKQFKYAVAKAESLLKQGKPKEAEAIVDKHLNSFTYHQTIPIDFQLRHTLLNQKIKSMRK